MELPNEIMNKIMRFNSHPVADLVQESIHTQLCRDSLWDEGYYYCECDDDVSFACFYFRATTPSIYSYEHMDTQYINTMNEYLKSNNIEQIISYTQNSQKCKVDIRDDESDY